MIATLIKIFLLYLTFLAVRAIVRVGLVVWQVKKGLKQGQYQQTTSYTYANQHESYTQPSNASNRSSSPGDTIEAEYKVIN